MEPFETTSGWLIETDTSGTGSTVARDNGQAYAGTYSAKCFTTNSGAKAQVRDIISSPWSGVSADVSSFIWQRAFLYVPAATASALTGTEYADIAAFYVSGDNSGWFLRLKENAALYCSGPGTSGQAEFNLYSTLPTDQWVQVEIGLWSRATGDLDRAFCVLINGKFHGWFTKGASGTNYDRAAMGIVATNSNDDLTVYVDNWYIFGTGSNPSGSDNRPTGNSYTKDYTGQSGENVGYHYITWENGFAMSATYGMQPTGRLQFGPEHSKMPDLSDGWSQIVMDWKDGNTPSWPPDNGNGNFYFPMVAFRKSVELEENLEIVPIYRPGGTPTVDLVFESWTLGPVEYAEWELPVDHTSGRRIPGRGDIIRVRWQEVTATNIRVRVDYYDASAGTWSLDVIDHTRDLSNVSGVNFLADTHRTVTSTIDSNDYTIKSQTMGTLATFPTSSPSASVSPSVSPSPSRSVSPSVSVSASPSVSPSISPSASVSSSVSRSASASVSPSVSLSISPSISPSVSPSISPSASESRSLSPSSSVSPSLSQSRSVSPSLSPSSSISLSISPSSSVSTSASRSLSPSASISPSRSVSASVSPSPSLPPGPLQSRRGVYKTERRAAHKTDRRKSQRTE